MMSRASADPAPITVQWLLLRTAILFPFVFLVLTLGFWLESRIPDWYYWKAALVFLLAEEVAYAVLVTVAVGGTLTIGALFVGGKQSQRRRAVLARPLLVCVSLLLAALMGEAACGIWQARLRGRSAMPIGGFGRDIGRAPESRFAATVNDVPLPSTFPDPPSDRDIDLVVMGESSAAGVPFSSWLSLGSILTWKMSEAIPDRPIRPRVIARSGDTLEWQHRELTNLPRRPELLIIYCGHNEFTSRLAGSRDLAYYFDEWLPTGREMLVDQIERSSWVCGLIRETAEKCRIAIPPPPSDHRKLVDVPVYSSSEYSTLVTEFRRRLDAIVSYAERVGALPVLISPAANDAGFEPSRSFLPAATTHNERESFQREFTAARGSKPRAKTPMRRSIAIARCSRGTLALPRLITASPESSSKRKRGMRHTITTSRPGIETATRCAVLPTSRRSTAKSHRDTTAFLLTHNRTFMRSVAMAFWMTSCFRTRCIHRFAARLPSHRRFCKRCTPGALLAGRSKRRSQSSILRNAPLTSASVQPPGASSVCGASSSTA